MLGISELAEKEGFEPSRPFRGLHDFQSCALDQLGDFSIVAGFSADAVVSFPNRRTVVIIPELFPKSSPFSNFLPTEVGGGESPPLPLRYPRASRMARRAVTRAGSPAGERMSGAVPASSLLEPSGFRPYIIVNWSRMPLLGRRIKMGFRAPMPSPLVWVPTSAAKPVAWQKTEKDSLAEYTIGPTSSHTRP